MHYILKRPPQLTAEEIATFKSAWDIPAWKELSVAEFREIFKDSEFHILYMNLQLVAFCRINLKFEFQIKQKKYSIAELVGLVAIVPSKGYGRELIARLRHSLKSRDLECIGFCFTQNRGFYKKCRVEVVPNLAHFFMEKDQDKWIGSEDDDILDINLLPNTLKALHELSAENPAYLLTSAE